jgi:sRNA-binding protein
VKPAVPAPPAETKPATPAAETPAAPAAPGEAKPAEQKPAEQKPAEQKPAEKKPAEKKPADDPFGQNNGGALRLWADSTGRYQIEARFVSVNDGVARLQKANGSYVRVAVDRLSVADQRYVSSQSEAVAASW